MKNTLILLMLFMLANLAQAQTGRVKIDITNIVAEWGGTVKVALFEKDGFPKEGQAVNIRDVPVRDIKASIIIEEIPVGNYAIAVYQDLNADNKLNRTIYGQPTEPYAFSNNVFGRFGPPKFDQVAFRVSESGNIKLVIHLQEIGRGSDKSEYDPF